MNFFNGKTVLVTGGAQGIGKAAVKAFLKNKARAAVLDIDAEALAEAESELGALGEVLAVEADVADEEGVKNAVARTVERFGGLDVLINNAGIFSCKSLEDLSLESWNRVIGVNLTGMFLCAKHCAAHLKKSCGAMVNIASTRAFQSEPDSFAYSASKGGVVALTHALAVSLGPEVRVNCIAPGWIEVSAWKKSAHRSDPRLSPGDHAQHPAGRVGRPEDIAELALFLASDKAGFITGACFTADGGMTKKMIYLD